MDLQLQSSQGHTVPYFSGTTMIMSMLRLRYALSIPRFLRFLFLSPPPSFLFSFFFSPSLAMFLVGPASTPPAPLPSMPLVLVRILSSQWRFVSLRRFFRCFFPFCVQKGFSLFLSFCFLCFVLLLNKLFCCLFCLLFFFLIF